MLSKTMNEQDVRNMFSTFGVIEECSILRDNNGQSKGMPFLLTYNISQSINCWKFCETLNASHSDRYCFVSK